MSHETPQPTAGSLSAKVIRACPQHKSCSLDCPARTVEDLGEIAAFDTRAESPDLRARLAAWLQSVWRSA